MQSSSVVWWFSAGWVVSMMSDGRSRFFLEFFSRIGLRRNGCTASKLKRGFHVMIQSLTGGPTTDGIRGQGEATLRSLPNTSTVLDGRSLTRVAPLKGLRSPYTQCTRTDAVNDFIVSPTLCGSGCWTPLSDVRGVRNVAATGMISVDCNALMCLI